MKLQEIYSNLDSILIKTQTDLEDCAERAKKANDVYVECFINYRQEKAKRIKELIKEGHSITLIRDIANGDTAEVRGLMMKAENLKKNYEKKVMIFIERLNTFKFIGRAAGKLAGDV